MTTRGCLVEPLRIGFKSLASLTFLRFALQSNVSVFYEHCSEDSHEFGGCVAWFYMSVAVGIRVYLSLL